MLKKLFAAMLSLNFVFGLCVPISAQNTEQESEITESKTTEKSDYAEIIFNKQPITKNIKEYHFSDNDVRRQVTYDGKEGTAMIPSARCLYMMIDLDDNVFPKVEEGEVIEITVEYFDTGTGHFTLRYDATNGSSKAHNDVVRMEDSREWKTHTFYMEDASFANSLENTDFNIAMCSTRTNWSISSDDVIIHSVRVEKAINRKPVKINLQSEEYGNIFSADDKKEMYFHLNNVTETEVSLNCKYTVVDEENNVYETGAFEKTVAPKQEDVTEAFTTELKKYGLYKVLLEGTMEYDFDGEHYTKDINNRFDFSIVNKFTPNEEKNVKFGVATHMGQTTDRTFEKTTKILAESGMGMLRDGIQWNELERQIGVYDFTGIKGGYLKDVKENGEELLMLAWAGNPLYASCEGNWRGMPTAKEDMEAFGRYVLECIEESDGAITSVEIWNEPNYYSVFNVLERGPEVYTELIKTVYPMIKEKYPDVTVVGPGLTGISKEWLEPIFAAGGGDYLDAVSVHAYDWSGDIRFDNYRESLPVRQELMEKYNVDAEVWYTELGWDRTRTSEENQAKYLIEYYTFIMANDYADRIFAYEFQDTGTDTLDQEHNFGMISFYKQESDVINAVISGGADRTVEFADVGTPWSAHKSYVAVTAMNKIIGTAEFEKEVEIGQYMQAYQFKRKDGKNAIIMWADNGANNIALKLDTKTAEIYDWFSNSETIKSDDGIFNITVTDKPSYIVGDFTTAELTESIIETGAVNVQFVKDDFITLNYTDKLNRDLRIDVECADIFTVTENTGIKNGKGSVTIYGNPNSSLTEYTLKVNLYDGDDICYSGTVNVEFIEPISITTEVYEKAGTLDRWGLKVKLENKSSKVYSGNVKIVEPEDISVMGNEPKFSNLQPGKSITLPINLPREIKKRAKDVTVEVELSNDKKVSDTQRMAFAEIKKTDVKPKIDGKVDFSEWNGTWIVVDQKEDIGATGFSGGWKGASDCSFSFNMMWDEDNLYMCLIAEDDIFSQNYKGYDMWQGDSIQIGLRDVPEDGVIDANFNEIGFALTSLGSEFYRYSSYSGQPSGIIENTQCSFNKETGRVVYELAIPWSEAMSEGYTPKTGNEIAFSALFNDNDGSGRRGWLEYTFGIGTIKSAKYFERIFLTE